MEKKRTWLKVALCTCGFGQYSDNVIIPLLSAIFKEYPSTGLFMQNFIITGCAVASIISALISGILMKHISKRKLLIFGTALFTIGGMGGFLSQSISFLAFTRVLDAASDGLLMAVSTSMVAEIFSDVKERGSVIGYSSAASCIFGIIVSFFAGIIAIYAWRPAFLLNGISLVSMILVIIFVPETSNGSITEENSSSKDDAIQNISVQEGASHYKLKAFGSMMFLLLMGSCGCQIYYLIDLFISERGIGDSALSGTITSICTGVTILTCIIFTKLYTKIKDYVIPLMPFVSALSLLFFALGNSWSAMLIASLFTGFAIGLSNVYFPLYVSEIAPTDKIERYLSIQTAVMYVYMFTGPYIPSFVELFTRHYSISDSYLYSGIALLILSVILLPFAVTSMKKKGKLTN